MLRGVANLLSHPVLFILILRKITEMGSEVVRDMLDIIKQKLLRTCNYLFASLIMKNQATSDLIFVVFLNWTNCKLWSITDTVKFKFNFPGIALKIFWRVS